MQVSVVIHTREIRGQNEAYFLNSILRIFRCKKVNSFSLEKLAPTKQKSHLQILFKMSYCKITYNDDNKTIHIQVKSINMKQVQIM